MPIFKVVAVIFDGPMRCEVSDFRAV